MSFVLNLQQLFFKVRDAIDFWHLRATAIAVLILCLPNLAFADQGLGYGFVCQDEQISAAPVKPALQSLTLEQAVKRVTRQSGGKILSARRIQTRKGPMFRIKVLTRTGLVRVVEIAEFEPPSVPN